VSLFRGALSRTEEPARTVERSAYAPSFSEWMALVSGGSTTGSVSVANAGTVGKALGHPAVFRSINKIAGIVAQMPMAAMRNGSKVDPTPALLRSPSGRLQRPSEWKRTMATSMLASGAGAALVDSDRPTRIDLIDPKRVEFDEMTQEWLLDRKPVKRFPEGPLWYVPLMTLPGSPVGVNPLEYARRTTYAGLAAQEFGGNFFAGGGHPTAIVAPEKDPGQDGAEKLKAKVAEATSGTNREPLVLPQTVKWIPLQINPDDSQFVELMGFSSAQLAGFFGLQPEHIGAPIEGSSVQYSNRENRQQDLLQDAIMPVVLPIEEALSELLPNGQTVKFNPEGLLRSDQAARFTTYELNARIQQMTGMPVLSNDEIRALENREPLNPGDYTQGAAE
jgi:HK97 family phage portal protein